MLVSIIIPYYDDEKNIKISVKSALNQTYNNTEIIIIDNENSNRSNNILKKLSKKSKKIKIVKNLTKLNYAGLGRNIGIKSSKGKFIAFLDSDDYWDKNKLKFQIAKCIKDKIDVLFTNFKAFNEKKKIIYSVKPPSSLNFNDLIKACPVCCSSVIILKKCFKKRLFKKLKTKEDYDLWLNLSKAGYKIQCLDRYLTYYKVRTNSLSSLHFNKFQNAFLIYYKSLKFSLIYSIFCVSRLYLNAFKKKYL